MMFTREIRIALYSIIAIIIIISAYVLFFSNNAEEDNTAPELTVLSQDFSIDAGEKATVSVNFSDNVKVTNATLHYRFLNESTWTNVSILNKSYSWQIPSSISENYAYFVTVDDKAGNGPIGDPSTNGSSYYTIYVLENSSGSDSSISYARYVFIEESTASDCTHCPTVANHLETLSASGNYPFYYVSMIQDNPTADNWLNSHYNQYGNPTVYVDGGYQVILGAKQKGAYEDAIQSALSRDGFNISINVTAEKLNTTTQAMVTIRVQNNEGSAYTGTLRLYLTEIISTTYSDYDGNRYHNAFLEFLLNEPIEIPKKSQKNFTKSFDVSIYEDFENLRVYAVLFGIEKNQQYSNPPDGQPFNAYYVDNADAADLVEEANLPPSVGFTSPKNGKIHILGNPILTSLTLKNTILIGRTDITIQASDPNDQAISKVELYVDDELVCVFDQEPYTWKLTGPSLLQFRHNLRAVAYDETGKSASDEKQIIAFILF